MDSIINWIVGGFILLVLAGSLVRYIKGIKSGSCHSGCGRCSEKDCAGRQKADSENPSGKE